MTIMGSHRAFQNACRRENMVATPGGHAASQNNLEIYLADDLSYIYVYYTCQHKINRYRQALQSVTVYFFAHRLFS